MKRALQAGLGLAFGLGLALLYAWVISPVQYVDTSPNTLRPEYRAAYAQLAARAFAVDGDLGRARTRLELLGLTSPAADVSTQAQSAGNPAGATALAGLAAALEGTPAATAAVSQPAETPEPGTTAASATPAPSDTPTPTVAPTDTVVPSITPNLLPTRTPSPTPLSAFVFVGQQQVCDPNLGQPLIQVVTENAGGEQIAGVEVEVVWDSGFDHFFTGLKPDLGAGYGDFTMTSGVVYSVHLAESPALTVDNLTAENCGDPGAKTYLGSLLLIFKQPH
jgi:hypothetical protein